MAYAGGASMAIAPRTPSSSDGAGSREGTLDGTSRSGQWPAVMALRGVGGEPAYPGYDGKEE